MCHTVAQSVFPAHVGIAGAIETAGSVTHHAVSPLIYSFGALTDFRSSVGTSWCFWNSMGFGVLASGARRAGRGKGLLKV